jgi:hypothetical protein
MEETQTRIHHTEPLIMTREIFSLLADYGMEPPLHLGIVHIVVVDPSLIPCIVRRIYVDTLHPSTILGEERLQGLEIVSSYDLILTRITPIVVLLVQETIWDLTMMVDDFVFSDPVESGHSVVLYQLFLCSLLESFFFLLMTPFDQRDIFGWWQVFWDDSSLL